MMQELQNQMFWSLYQKKIICKMINYFLIFLTNHELIQLNTIFISFLGEFLVSAPNRVEKISIGYAKQAKKMDMKRLKAVEWSILQTSCIEQDKENDTDNVNEAEKKKNNETGVESSTSFSHLYTNLSGSRLLFYLYS